MVSGLEEVDVAQEPAGREALLNAGLSVPEQQRAMTDGSNIEDDARVVGSRALRQPLVRGP